jgi:hypothetical protein
MGNVFIHGGRIGDCIYALHTVKDLGGGIFQVCLRHAPVRWDEKILKSLIPLLEYQKYIDRVIFTKVPPQYVMRHDHNSMWSGHQEMALHGADYIQWTHSFIDSESVNDPHNYPDLCNVNWLHYAHQSRRHHTYFRIKWDPDAVWLDAPKTRAVDIVFHAPSYRLVRSPHSWRRILNALQKRFNVILLSGEVDRYEWANDSDVIVPENLLDTADYINSAYCFLGCASSCYAIAEAMKKYRFVELAPDCFNNYPYGKTGRLINEWSDEEVIAHVVGFVNEKLEYHASIS